MGPPLRLLTMPTTQEKPRAHSAYGRTRCDAVHHGHGRAALGARWPHTRLEHKPGLPVRVHAARTPNHGTRRAARDQRDPPQQIACGSCGACPRLGSEKGASHGSSCEAQACTSFCGPAPAKPNTMPWHAHPRLGGVLHARQCAERHRPWCAQRSSPPSRETPSIAIPSPAGASDQITSSTTPRPRSRKLIDPHGEG